MIKLTSVGNDSYPVYVSPRHITGLYPSPPEMTGVRPNVIVGLSDGGTITVQETIDAILWKMEWPTLLLCNLAALPVGCILGHSLGATVYYISRYWGF